MSEIKTQRLILRPFVKEDVAALFQIMSDVTVNRFLPLFPLKTMEEARQYLQKNIWTVMLRERFSIMRFV